MDLDENDLLHTNEFLQKPSMTDVPPEMNDEFKKYYEQEQAQQDQKRVKDRLDRMSLKSSILEEDSDSGNLLNTHEFNPKSNDDAHSGLETSRKSKELKTYVSIDSRDRDKALYSKPNNFNIFLGRTFYNVKYVKLASMEFPNTNAVINSSNNRIYWLNQEDIDNDIIDNITKTYPVYSVELRIGSYTAYTLQTEISDKMAAVKRRNRTGDFHYFDVKLDLDTDVVSFTSLILHQAPNNALSTSAGLGIISVNLPYHGYKTGETIYIVGAKTLAGIPTTTLNGPQVITVINGNTFQFEVNVKASDTLQGGGNTLKSGRLAPFQLLFGDYTQTVAQNIGYPLENSSERVDTNIKSINNFYQARIHTTTPHNITESAIGQTCRLIGTNTSPSLDGTRVITSIIDSQTILVSEDSKIAYEVTYFGQLIFNNQTFEILSMKNYEADTVLVETFTNHNYDNTSIGNSIVFYNTTTVPNFDGSNTLFSVLSPTLLVIPGSLLQGGSVAVTQPGNAGSMPTYNPLTTKTAQVVNIIPGAQTTFEVQGHGLSDGDTIRFFNILSSPSIVDSNGGIHTVNSVLDANTFTVAFSTDSVDTSTVETGQAYIGYRTVQMQFPYHGFNQILDIRACIDTDPNYNVEVTTILPHGLSDGNTVRVMQTNTVPSIDDGGYIVKVIDIHKFRIVFPGGIGTSIGTFGIIGMSNDFQLYGAVSVGGIDAANVNSITYTVKQVLNQNQFTFDVNTYASKTETGGGSNIFITSLTHGFSGVQDNTKNNALVRSINLEGENYAFICCPQVASMLNTGSVKDIFARVTLDQSPGSMVFNFLSNPKEFDTAPLNALNELDFSVVNWDNTKYEFNDVDWSMCVEITEVVDYTDSFNLSSRRGIA